MLQGMLINSFHNFDVAHIYIIFSSSIHRFSKKKTFGEKKWAQYVYICFWGFMNTILLILRSMACSPLLVKYHAIEMTAITIIKTSMFKSTIVLMKQRHKGKSCLNMACLLATSQHHTVYHITTPHCLPKWGPMPSSNMVCMMGPLKRPHTIFFSSIQIRSPDIPA